MLKPFAKHMGTWGVVACVSLGLLAGCGGGQDGERWRQEQLQAPSPPPKSTSASPAAPTLTAGETVSVVTSPSDLLDIPGGSADITLISIKAARTVTDSRTGSTVNAEPGKQFICLEFKIKNTGDTEFDTYPFAHADWTGSDGEVQGLGHVLAIECEDLGQQGDVFTNQPEPGPGQFVRGTIPLSVPSTQSGRIEFSDRADVPLVYVETSPLR